MELSSGLNRWKCCLRQVLQRPCQAGFDGGTNECVRFIENGIGVQTLWGSGLRRDWWGFGLLDGWTPLPAICLRVMHHWLLFALLYPTLQIGLEVNRTPPTSFCYPDFPTTSCFEHALVTGHLVHVCICQCMLVKEETSIFYYTRILCYHTLLEQSFTFAQCSCQVDTPVLWIPPRV